MPIADTTTGLRLRHAQRSLICVGILSGARDTGVTANHHQKEALGRRERDAKTFAEIGRSDNLSGWTILRLAAV